MLTTSVLLPVVGDTATDLDTDTAHHRYRRRHSIFNSLRGWGEGETSQKAPRSAPNVRVEVRRWFDVVCDGVREVEGGDARVDDISSAPSMQKHSLNGMDINLMKTE